MFFIGFEVAFIKYLKTDKTNFRTAEYNITFEGKINGIKLTSQENILIINITKSPNTSLTNQNVRIKISDEMMQKTKLNINNFVKIKSSLMPIKYSNFPNDKSYENYAKFFDIIATGKAKEIEVLTDKQPVYEKFDLFQRIQKLRNNIQKRIFDVNNKSAGSGIIISLLTGNNGFIPKKQLENIRHSGCAHILAISGLHMSIIVAFVFFISIHILSLFPNIALRYNTKKLSIIPAFLTCMFYINIANIPISALRSFLMISISSIAIFLDRRKSSLSIVFITFFIMLLFSPNYILSPSFQMSFMAVFGLVSWYNNNIITESNIFNKKKNLINYTIGILMSSIIATISTVFFEIYHFKQYAWIGLISNIAVIPLTEFLVLPIGFIGMIFNGTTIGDFFYLLSGFFANIVCIITDFTADLPNSFLLAKQMTTKQLCFIIIGIVLLFLSRSKVLKLFGIITIITTMMFYIFSPNYLLVYDKNFQNIVFLENNKYYSVFPMKNNYIKSIWCQNLGINYITPSTNKNKNIKCVGDLKNNNMECKYYLNDRFYFFNQAKSNKVVGVKFINNKFLEFYN